MNIEREKLLSFVKEYEILSERLADIKSDIKEYVDAWIEENDIEKKKPFMLAVKSFIK